MNGALKEAEKRWTFEDLKVSLDSLCSSFFYLE